MQKRNAGNLSEAKAVGLAVQAYLRAKWQPEQLNREAMQNSEPLVRDLQHRVDALGFDGEQLLLIEPTQVLLHLEKLEHEAMLEDAKIHVDKNAATKQQHNRRKSGSAFARRAPNRRG